MITIPAIADAQGVLHPADPIPPHALAAHRDGTAYRVAETPEEAAILCPPQPAPTGDEPQVEE